jgi:hypothetical protein
MPSPFKNGTFPTRLLSIATAVPPLRVSQAEALQFILKRFVIRPGTRALYRRVFAHESVATRHFSLKSLEEVLDPVRLCQDKLPIHFVSGFWPAPALLVSHIVPARLLPQQRLCRPRCTSLGDGPRALARLKTHVTKCKVNLLTEPYSFFFSGCPGMARWITFSNRAGPTP